MWWGSRSNHKTSLHQVKVHFLVTATGHPTVPSAFTVWMAKTGKHRKMARGYRGPPQKVYQMHLLPSELKKCQRDWIHWLSTSGGRSVLSYNQGCSGKWALFILLWSFVYFSFSRIDEHRHTVKPHLQTAPNRCNRDSLQAPRSTHTNKFERAGHEQTALNHKFCTLRKHRGYHRRWSITWVK